MSAVAGILAGLVTAAGAVTLYRVTQRRVRAVRDSFLDTKRHEPSPQNTLDFERDPETGVFRAK